MRIWDTGFGFALVVQTIVRDSTWMSGVLISKENCGHSEWRKKLGPDDHEVTRKRAEGKPPLGVT